MSEQGTTFGSGLGVCALSLKALGLRVQGVGFRVEGPGLRIGCVQNLRWKSPNNNSKLQTQRRHPPRPPSTPSLTSFLACTFAFAATSALIAATQPFPAAKCSGVNPACTTRLPVSQAHFACFLAPPATDANPQSIEHCTYVVHEGLRRILLEGARYGRPHPVRIGSCIKQ